MMSRTQFDRLFVMWDTSQHIGLQQVPARDVDLSLQVATMEAWIYHQLVTKTDQIADIREEMTCRSLDNQMRDQHLTALGGGWFSIVDYDAVVEVLCTAVIVTVRDTEGLCYSDIPIEGEQGFVDVVSRTIKKDSRRVDCDTLRDKYVRDVHGAFWRLGRKSVKTVTPRAKRPGHGKKVTP